MYNFIFKIQIPIILGTCYVSYHAINLEWIQLVVAEKKNHCGVISLCQNLFIMHMLQAKVFFSPFFAPAACAKLLNAHAKILPQIRVVFLLYISSLNLSHSKYVFVFSLVIMGNLWENSLLRDFNWTYKSIKLIFMRCFGYRGMEDPKPLII